MTVAADIATESADRSKQLAMRPLTIFAIGYAQSAHVRMRVQCFAELGHRVFLLTETAVEPPIPRVIQLVPVLNSSTAVGRALAAVRWLLRKVFGAKTDHAWRGLMFLKFLWTTRPDIVHVHFAYAYYAWMAALMGCRPLVVTVMGGDVLFDEQGSPSREGKWLTLQLLRNADYITSKSNYITAALDRLGGFGQKADRILWGIPIARWRCGDASALRSSLGLAPRRRVILSPRALQPFYQIDLIVEAMPRILERHPDAVLLITEYAADGKYRAQIADRIRVLGLGDHVRLCGAVPHAGMPEYYRLSEIAVSVPRSDGMPQTLFEAMACGVPNVLSRLPHYRELIAHEESAYFVDTDPEGIAAGINQLLDDAELRGKIRQAALVIVQQQADLDTQARRVERRYRELVKNCNRRTFRLGHFISTAIALRKEIAGAR